MIKKLSVISLSLLAIILIFSCGPKNRNGNKNTTTSTTKKPPYGTTGNEGILTGVVKFEGTPSAPKKIDMSGDAVCAGSPGEKTIDDVVVTDGKLANVLVYVTGGKLADFSFPAPSEPIVLDQQGCRYHPRVLGIQTGQP